MQGGSFTFLIGGLSGTSALTGKVKLMSFLPEKACASQDSVSPFMRQMKNVERSKAWGACETPFHNGFYIQCRGQGLPGRRMTGENETMVFYRARLASKVECRPDQVLFNICEDRNCHLEYRLSHSRVDSTEKVCSWHQKILIRPVAGFLPEKSLAGLLEIQVTPPNRITRSWAEPDSEAHGMVGTNFSDRNEDCM